MLFAVAALIGGLLTGAHRKSGAATVTFVKKRWKPVVAVVAMLALVAVLGDHNSSATADTRWIFAAAAAGWLIGRLLRHELRTRIQPATTGTVAVQVDPPTVKR